MAYPLIRVPSITAPRYAEPGKKIDISFVWHNHGGEGWAWWRLVDLDTFMEYIPRKTGGCTPGSEFKDTASISMPIRNLRVRIEVGHIEKYGMPGENYVLDESHDVTVRLIPTPPIVLGALAGIILAVVVGVAYAFSRK